MAGNSTSSMQVCIKLRACEPGSSSLWQVKDGRSIQLADGRIEPQVFDHAFGEEVGNREVFEQMGQRIVRACVLGVFGTILSYGSKASGKTATMMGDYQDPGVMMLSAKYIFELIAKENRNFDLRASYLEIHNDKVNDLLDTRNHDLKIRDAPNGIAMVSCAECVINSEQDLLRIIYQGNKERSTQSHAILRVFIESYAADRSERKIQSMLSLVDLAGAERLGADSPTGSRTSGGVHINKSLMFLTNLVKNLADNKYMSFRVCKLTRFLQASLSSKAFTSIICMIRPWVLEESQSTLNFAMCVRKICTNKSGHGTSTKQRDSPMKEHDTPIKEHDTPIKEHDSPITEHDTPIKEHGTPIKEHDTPIKEHDTPIKEHDTPMKEHGTSMKKHDTPMKGPDTPIKEHDTPMKGHDTPIKESDTSMKETDTSIMERQDSESKAQIHVVDEDFEIGSGEPRLSRRYESLPDISTAGCEDPKGLLPGIPVMSSLLRRSKWPQMQAYYFDKMVTPKENIADPETDTNAADLQRIETVQENDFPPQEESQELVTSQEEIPLNSDCEEAELELMETLQEEKDLPSDDIDDPLTSQEEMTFNTADTDVDQPMKTLQKTDLTPKAMAAVNEPPASPYFDQHMCNITDSIQDIRIDIQSNFSRLFESFGNQNQGISRDEQEKLISKYKARIRDLNVLLMHARDEIQLNEQIKAEEIHAIREEYKEKIQKIEKVTRAKCEMYIQDWLANKEEVLRSGEELSRLTDSCYADMAEFQNTYKNMEDTKAYLKECIQALEQKLLQAEENLKEMAANHSFELKKLRADFAARIKHGEDERKIASNKLALLQEEFTCYKEERWAQVDALKNEHQEIANYWQEQMEVIQKTHDELKAQNAKRQNKLDIALQQIESLTACNELLKEELKNVRLAAAETKSNLQAKVDVLKTKVHDLKAKLHDSKEIIAAQNLKTQNIEVVLKAKDTANEELSAKLEAVKCEMSIRSEEFQNDLAELKFDKSELQDHNYQLDATNNELRAKIKLALEAKDTANAKLSAMASELEAVSYEMSENKEEMESKISDLNISKNELKAQNNKLEMTNNELRADLKIALEAKDTANAKLSAMASELDAVSYEMSKNKEEMGNEISDLNISKNELQAQNNELEATNIELRADLKIAIEAKDTANAKLSSMASELDAVSKIKEEMGNEISDLNISKNELQAQNNQLQVSNIELRANHKIALEAKDTANVELSSQLEAVTYEMSIKIEELEKELTKLNISTNQLQDHNNELKVDNKKLKKKLKTQMEHDQKLSANLRTEWEETKAGLEEQLRNQEAEAHRKLMEKEQEVENGRQHIGELTKDCENLRCLLQTKSNSFQSEKEIYESEISKLSENIMTLVKENEALKRDERGYAAIIANLNAHKIEADNQKSIADAANKKNKELTEKIERLEAEWKSTHTSLLKDRSNILTTNSSLLDDKRNLEEKQCTLSEKIEKLEVENASLHAIIINQCSSPAHNGSTSRVEPHGSSVSLSPRRPPTSNNSSPESSTSAAALRKPSLMQCTVRRNMRKAVYDVHRTQLETCSPDESDKDDGEVGESTEAQGPAEENTAKQKDPASQQ